MGITCSAGKIFAEEVANVSEISGLNKDSHLQKLILSDTELKTHYNSCKGDTAKDWTACLWERVQGNAELKKKVMTASKLDKREAPIIQVLPEHLDDFPLPQPPKRSEDTKKIMSMDNSINVSKINDPFVRKLQENIEKQLDSVFTTASPDIKGSKGEVNSQAPGRTYLATDHSIFSSLYNTHLSNSIVQSLAMFCSETEYDQDENKFFIFSDSKKRKNSLNNNLLELEKAKLSPLPPEYQKYCSDGENYNQELCAKYNPCNKASELYDQSSCRFNGCVYSVNRLCHKTDETVPSKGVEKVDTEYTKERACEVIEFIKTARASIMSLSEQEKFYQKIQKNGSSGIALQGMRSFQSDGDVSRNSQDIVTITSKTAREADESSKDEITTINCIGKDGQIVNQSSCDKLMLKNPEEARESLTELRIRRESQIEEIEGLSTIEQLKKILISEGDTEEEADKLIEKLSKEATETNSLIDLLKKRITSKYRTETEAVISALAQKVSRTTIEEKDDPETRKNKFRRVQDELRAKGERYTNMIRYGNIVSSYLTLSDGASGKSSVNSNQLFKELASTRDLDSTKTIEENARQAGIVSSTDDTSSTTLDVRTINNDLLKKNQD